MKRKRTKVKGNRTLRRFRLSIPMTQKAFAHKARLHPVYLSQVETGRYALGHRAGLKICSAFPVEISKARLTLEDFLRDPDRSR